MPARRRDLQRALGHFLPFDLLQVWSANHWLRFARLGGAQQPLPFEMRQGALGPKHLLKKVFYRYVPRQLVERPKRGFAVPVKEWLAGDMEVFVDEHLNIWHITRQGLFDPAMVRAYVRRLHAGDITVRQRVWLLVAFHSTSH